MKLENLRIYKASYGETAAACEIGIALFESALDKSYKRLDTTELKNLMITGIKLSNQDGLVKLLESEENLDPVIYFKTAIMSTVGIVAAGTYCCVKELAEEEEPNYVFARNITKMLKGIMEYYITANSPETKRMATTAANTLIKGKLGEFIRVVPMIAPEVKTFFNALVDKYRTALNSVVIDENEKEKHSPFSNFALNQQLATAYYGMDNTIFIYGTLMKGERANYMLKGSYYAGEFILEGYGCYELGDYPIIIEEAGAKVEGQVYHVMDDVIEELDQYIGEGELCTRITVPVKSKFGGILAETYVYTENHNGGFK